MALQTVVTMTADDLLVMPHNGYRAFDDAATLAAFPDFRYTQPADGFAKVHAEIMERA